MTQPNVTITAAELAEKDDRIVRQQNQIDRLLTNTEGDQRVIQNLRAEINRMRQDTTAYTPAQLLALIRGAIEVEGADVTVSRVEDDSFTLRVVGATIRDHEIVPLTRRWRVDGTITVPVSFVVEAADESEAEMFADDVLSGVGMNVESDLDMASPDDCEEFGAGMNSVEVDRIDED